MSPAGWPPPEAMTTSLTKAGAVSVRADRNDDGHHLGGEHHQVAEAEHEVADEPQHPIWRTWRR